MINFMWQFCAALALLVRFCYSFPDSGNPITVEPPLTRPDSKSYKVIIFDEAPCSAWDLVSTAAYVPPETTGPWSRIILDVTFTENGTQFDRFGALWMGGVELLRTTTAEPTADGISWFVEKDVTSYSTYLGEPSTAYLSIPNNIDDTYTGIPLVTVSLTFFEADAANPALPEGAAPTLLPVTNNPAAWDDIAVSAGSNLSYSVTVPYADVVAVQLDLMASAHGCEEFWYTNVDDDEAAEKFGLCGGGVYREIQVFVDGVLAGATYPFPVVYTGGINPFLWRPLTGIMSFDIPAFEFDLTPFVLGDGRPHELAFKVLGGDDEGGVWYLDGTLLLFRDAASAPVSGGLRQHRDSGCDVSSSSAIAPGGGYSWNTSGTHSYSAQGEIILGGRQGQSVSASVEGDMSSWNTNHIGDPATKQDTAGALTASHASSLAAVLAAVRQQQGGQAAEAEDSAPLRRSSLHYPYVISSTYAQDATTMDMAASVSMRYSRAQDTAGGQIRWDNAIASDAAYNRSLDHATVYVESDEASARFEVSSGGQEQGAKACYVRSARAAEGYVTSDEQNGLCVLPVGHYVCGYVLCSGNPRATGAARVSAASAELPTARTVDSGRPRVEQGALPLRHPLMGRARLSVGGRP